MKLFQNDDLWFFQAAGHFPLSVHLSSCSFSHSVKDVSVLFRLSLVGTLVHSIVPVILLSHTLITPLNTMAYLEGQLNFNGKGTVRRHQSGRGMWVLMDDHVVA